MRPVVVTAVLLLVVLMSMSASAAWTPELMCRTKYPATPCKIDATWLQFGPNRCVKVFHSSRLNHGKARRQCKNYSNGELVSIHSLAELSQLECAMYRATTTKNHYWIGMHRTNKGLVWTDGSKHDYSNWANGQPDSRWLKREHCIEMNYWSWGLWNDNVCYWENPYVCQVRVW